MQLRKIGTALVGAVLTSATLMGGAFAADLGNYPAPFATDADGIQSTIVIGSSGAVQDVVGAINIGAALAQVGGTVAGGVAATTTATGVEADDVALGTAVNTQFATALKDNDVAGLLDTKVSWNDEDVDVEETITIAAGLEIGASVTADEDFGADVVMITTAKDSVVYKFIVDDSDFNRSLVTDAEPLDITILGKSIKITEIGTDGKIELSEGIETAMTMDTTVEVGGKTLEVTAIGDGTVAFKVGADTEFIDTGDTTEVGNSGIKVRVDNVLYTDEAATRQVLVTVGTDITSTIEDGDSMELFGEPEDEDEAVWTWVVDVTGADSTFTIGAAHSQKFDNDDEAYVALGDSIALPNDYAFVTLTELTETDMGTYEISFDDGIDFKLNAAGDSNSNAVDDQTVIVFKSEDSEDGFKIDGEETDTIYVSDNQTAGLAFLNDDGDIQQIAVETFNITYEDSVYVVNVNSSVYGNITITEPAVVGGVINVVATTSFDRIGALEAEISSGDVTYDGANMAGKEDDVRTTYGTILVDVENNGDSDVVVIEVPADEVKATVTVSGTGSTVTAAAAVEGGYTPAALPATGIAKLDSDAEAAKTGNLILVGGPAVNSIVAELAAAGKTRTATEWRTETDGVRDYADSALIQAVDDAFTDGKTALVVAGYGADDTGNAAYVLQNYAKFADQLAGKAEVAVTGTTTDAVQ
ncbi:MAG: hypothetical protein GQ477_01625 [Nanohaloarchaea archaeon]|nr:hypothetical protein [Candidatus Nanohaloarchaea archaeon]